MVFSSTEFLFLFLPGLLLLYYFPLRCFKNKTYRNVLLLLASLFFYAWGEPIFIFVMILSIIANWLFGLYIGKTKTSRTRKLRLVLAVVFNVGVLFVFKYLSFLSENIAVLINNSNLAVHIELPIGISFFTFQALSYIFDVYYEKTEYQQSLLHIALYISFFPQLVAGPIVRYDDIEKEICNREIASDEFFEGVKRFVYGLGKKSILANSFGLLVDEAFALPLNNSITFAWIGAIAYTLQIYFDFSGYSDMAIGLGRMFGFHFNENFNYPYIASSVTDFWRRWHISLSSWFKDYVYIPLGGNRFGKQREIKNLFIVWALTGIWHGANWTFLAWGMFYFVVLLCEKKFNFVDKVGKFSHIYTMLVIILAWVIFKSNTITDCFYYLRNMFGLNGNALIDSTTVSVIKRECITFVVGVVGALPTLPVIRKNILKNKAELVEEIFVLALFIYSLIKIVSSTYNPFIYFNF